MTNKLFSPRFLFITSAIFVAAFSRLLPHIPNFTPIAAMALFGGVYFTNKRLAFIIPLIAMLLSDIVLELTTGFGMHNTLIYVYAAFALTSVIGLYVRRNINVQTIFVASLLSSILFFTISNFGVWAATGAIGGAAGLGATYILGIPFFAPTLLGDLCFNAILFGAFYVAQRKIPALARVS